MGLLCAGSRVCPQCQAGSDLPVQGTLLQHQSGTALMVTAASIDCPVVIRGAVMGQVPSDQEVQLGSRSSRRLDCLQRGVQEKDQAQVLLQRSVEGTGRDGAGCSGCHRGR